MHRVAALCFTVVLLAGCSLFVIPTPLTKLTGMWQERLPDGYTTKLVSLWIQPNGRATFEMVTLGQDRGAPVVAGRWSLVDDTQLTVQLGDDTGKPQGQPLVYDVAGDRLIPKRWDHKLYGPEGLPLRKREH
ncbi:MAG TPA: hypothetical protein VGR62_14325 [Candidatus Binatia bacterium]|jgi:hypothetical protein|nr:hypothetical protein [Candidatus Binatia bacterium]